MAETNQPTHKTHKQQTTTGRLWEQRAATQRTGPQSWHAKAINSANHPKEEGMKLKAEGKEGGR